MKELLYKVAYSGDPTFDDFYLLMESIVEGKANDIHLAALFAILGDRPIRGDDIHNFTLALEEYTVRVKGKAIDICGTGGSGHSKLSISTAAAFVVAAAGVPVAKHGGHSVEGNGCADVLHALGAEIAMGPDLARKVLRETGFTFLYAPTYNKVLAMVGGFRERYGLPTMFNLCAPLINPICPYGQVIGVSECSAQPEYIFPLMMRKTQIAILVSGTDGLDEATTSSKTHVTTYRFNHPTKRTILKAEDVEMESCLLSAIKGGDAKFNAEALKRLLSHAERGPYRDIVLLNAGYALQAAGVDKSILDCVDFLAPYLDKGNAAKVLDDFVKASQG